MKSILNTHRLQVLPLNPDETCRLNIRRTKLWEDTLHAFRHGLQLHKHLRVTFIGEPAVDTGSPLREFFHLLMKAVAGNNNLFTGDRGRIPTSNLAAVENKTYFYIGQMLALSLLHGGPAPSFFCGAVGSYLVNGMSRVKAEIADVPNKSMRVKLVEVHIYLYMI